MTPGRAVCAWCGEEMGIRAELRPGTISHGLCAKCEAKENARLDALEKKRRGENEKENPA